ncbi:hypothetical protein R75461_05294 [Paraburkholderia nemoris]|uniref:hypothetical protein n=1 Tax=Paraburkholderia nemoris TaxID=2793076 RepID=UPI00190969BB|nr:MULTISPECIES: hypothetical protein [Paraburkholderia]MBK3783950.1 hypothetical protein [Paraburkholderia aspalathi]CAE6803332.1 hypothetical protein R75461_05294 [Paraburkholderia nemoris]
MSVKFVTPAKPAPAAPQTDAPAYRVQPKPVTLEYLRGPGSVRVQHLMYLLHCSYSTVFKRLARGHIPAPTGGDPRPYWSNEVIRKHLGIESAAR